MKLPILLTTGVLALSALSFAKMEYTGDKYLGKDVITNLDVADLQPGQVYEFFFQGTENSLGRPRFIPVTVIKGKTDGKRFLINSGVHGNEVNPILTSYKVKENLNPDNVNGTVTIVHGMNVSGLLNNTRGYSFGGNSGATVDINRQMDSGKTSTSDQKYATNVWQNLLSKNADRVIDLHTGGKNGEFPLFTYADYRNPEIRKMAELTGSDIIKMDSGEKGSVETSFVLLGVPAITFELGKAETVQADIVDRAVAGVLNNLAYSNNLTGRKVEDLSKNTFVGNNWDRIRTEKGGYVESKVNLKDKVKKGDLIYIQYDPFGKVVKEYTAPNDGIVTSRADYPFMEPGDSLGRILFYNPQDKEQILKDKN